MEAIVLAGGLGTRLRSVVADRPKPMADVSGKPFLEHLVSFWKKQGVSHFVLAVGYLHQQLKDYFGPAMTYSVEEEPRGTGGALFLATDHLKTRDDFLLLNGDTFFDVSLTAFQALHRSSHAKLTVALKRVEANTRYAGVGLGSNGAIESFGTESELINGGVYLMNRDLIDRYRTRNYPVSLEKDILPVMLQDKVAMIGMESAGAFVDIGIPSDYAASAPIIDAHGKKGIET